MGSFFDEFSLEINETEDYLSTISNLGEKIFSPEDYFFYLFKCETSHESEIWLMKKKGKK